MEVLDYQQQHAVKLSVLFKRDVIPASHSQISKVKVAWEWEQLCPIADKLMPYDRYSNIEISLHIGSNCPSVVRPREAFMGADNEPYGQRMMGWGIIGAMEYN